MDEESQQGEKGDCLGRWNHRKAEVIVRHMCGIVCIANKAGIVDQVVLSHMTEVLSHRGPDWFGTYLSETGEVGLGSTRLSILDPSLNGSQPMQKHGRIISFNGEVYNYRQIARELEGYGYRFESTTDTETVLSAFDKWGIGCLERFNGFFAFVLYDSHTKELYVARDRLGIKQIVFAETPSAFLFASEAKALLKHPEVSARPNLKTIETDLIFTFFGDKSETYFEGIHHVQAGHYLVVKDGEIKDMRYWDLQVEEHNMSCLFQSEQAIAQYVNDLYHLLMDAVSLRLLSDRRIGSLLSGGVDSSLIAHFASQELDQPLQCFTLGYEGDSNPDIEYAQILANHNHNLHLHPIYLAKTDLDLDLIDRLTYHMEELIFDKSYAGVYKNYEVARQSDVKVVLNGQGSDEAWLGYYFFLDLFRFNPSDLTFDSQLEYWERNYFLRKPTNSNRVRDLVAHNLELNFRPFTSGDVLNSMVAFSIKTHLQSMLMQEDRLSMAHGVECRLPFTDYRIIELAMRTPSRLKLWDGREKYPIRKVGEIVLPHAIHARHKAGFPKPPIEYQYPWEELPISDDMLRGRILREILGTSSANQPCFLPPKWKWRLFAITRLEKVFFS